MNPIVVEHVFVTTLHNTQVLPLLGEALRSRGFQREGTQQLDPLRPDWTLINFSRGLPKPRAKKFSDFRQDIRIEWDRHRLTFALSIDPGMAGSALRQQVTELLLLRASLLEDLAAGTRAPNDVLAEWTSAEATLGTTSPADFSAQAPGTPNAFFQAYWVWSCIALCIFMAIAALTFPGYSTTLRIIFAFIGGAAALGIAALGFLGLSLPINRLKINAWAIAIGCWVAFVIATVYVTTIAHMNPNDSSDSAVQNSDRSPDNPPPPPPPPQTYDGALSDLASSDHDKQVNAFRWLGSGKVPAGADANRLCSALRPLLADDDVWLRQDAVRFFCKYAGASQSPDLVKCLAYPERYAGCWTPALETLVKVDPAAAAKAVRQQPASSRFNDEVMNTLRRVADSAGSARTDAKKIADALDAEHHVAQFNSTLADLASPDANKQREAVRWLDSNTIPAGTDPARICKALRPALALEDQWARADAVRLLCKYAGPSQAPDLVICLACPERYADCWAPALETLIKLDPAAAGKAARSQPASRRFNDEVMRILIRIADSPSPAKADAQKLADALDTEFRLAQLKSGQRVSGKLRSFDEALAAASSSSPATQSDGAQYFFDSALTADQTRQAKDSLRKLLASDNRDVLSNGSRAFIKLAGKDDLKDLTKLAYADDQHGYVRAPAIAAILLLDTATGKKLLEAAAKDGGLRSGVFSELNKSAAAAEPVALELLKSYDHNIQHDAIDTLAKFGSPKSVPALQLLANSADKDLRGLKKPAQDAIDNINRREKARSL